MAFINFVLFIISCIFIYLSASVLVKNLAKIAQIIHLTRFTAAFIIMGVLTSLPELFVGISSALAKNSSMGFGNIIGSNILDITLVMGIIVLSGRGIKIKNSEVGKDSLIAIIISLIAIILLISDKKLSELDGIILIALFLILSYNMLNKKTKYHHIKNEKVKKRYHLWNIVIFIISAFILFISARFAITQGAIISSDIGMPIFFIGIFLLSFGTALPELSFGIRAATAGYGEMSLGDQIGGIIIKSTLILGIISIISPIVFVDEVLISVLFSVFTLLIFFLMVKTGRKISMREGIFLILMYVIFSIIQIFLL